MGVLSMTELGLAGAEQPGRPRCLPCHFRHEERFAFTFLPGFARRRISTEHGQIRAAFLAGRVPHALLESHADYEDRIFPAYLPPGLAASLRADHDSYRITTPVWDC